MYVGRLRQETTPEAVKRFLERKGIEGEMVCDELTSISSKSFKVGIAFNLLDKTTDTNFWPAGIVVRRFRFFWRSEGASLE